MITQSYKQGDIIFKEGDTGDCMYQICSGSVDIILNYGTPLQATLLTKSVGGFFGELSLINKAARSGTVVAATDCEVQVVDASHAMDGDMLSFEFVHRLEETTLKETNDLMRKFLESDATQMLFSEECTALRKKIFAENPRSYVKNMVKDIEAYKTLSRSFASAIAVDHTGTWEETVRATLERFC